MAIRDRTLEDGLGILAAGVFVTVEELLAAAGAPRADSHACFVHAMIHGTCIQIRANNISQLLVRVDFPKSRVSKRNCKTNIYNINKYIL